MQQQQNSLKTWQIFESKKLTVFMCDHHTSILAHWLPARFHFTWSVFWTMRHTKHKHCTTCCFARCLNSVSVLFFNSCNGDCLDARLKHNWTERAFAKLLLTFIMWWSLFTCVYWFTQCERLCIVYAAVCPVCWSQPELYILLLFHSSAEWCCCVSWSPHVESVATRCTKAVWYANIKWYAHRQTTDNYASEPPPRAKQWSRLALAHWEKD